MSDSKRFSRSAMNKMEYGGANLVPIAVPLFCLKVLSKNWKKLFLYTHVYINQKEIRLCS